MNSKIVTHKIADNQLRIENTEVIGLGITKIIVGVENSDQREIITNPTTGFPYLLLLCSSVSSFSTALLQQSLLQLEVPAQTCRSHSEALYAAFYDQTVF